MPRFLLRKLIQVNRHEERDENRSSVLLWVLEELMFWGGLFVFLTNSGLMAWLGGFLALASIVLAFVLLY